MLKKTEPRSCSRKTLSASQEVVRVAEQRHVWITLPEELRLKIGALDLSICRDYERHGRNVVRRLAKNHRAAKASARKTAESTAKPKAVSAKPQQSVLPLSSPKSGEDRN